MVLPAEPWVPLRQRDKYKQLNEAVHDAVCAYYTDEKNIANFEAICLAAYRLIKYIINEMRGLDFNTHLDKIPSFSDALMEFYCTADGTDGESYEKEVAALENLSRSAYYEFKKPLQDEYHHDIM